MRVGSAVVVGRTARFERTALVEELMRALRAAYGPDHVHQEYLFAGITGRRRWRFDVAVLSARIAIEIQGFSPTGAHGKAWRGLENDCRKYAEAAALGWHVFPVTYAMLREGTVLELVLRQGV